FAATSARRLPGGSRRRGAPALAEAGRPAGRPRRPPRTRVPRQGPSSSTPESEISSSNPYSTRSATVLLGAAVADVAVPVLRGDAALAVPALAELGGSCVEGREDQIEQPGVAGFALIQVPPWEPLPEATRRSARMGRRPLHGRKPDFQALRRGEEDEAALLQVIDLDGVSGAFDLRR